MLVIVAIKRQIIFDRLRSEPNWDQLDWNGANFAPYVEYVGQQKLQSAVAFYAMQVFWQLVIEGILAPGTNSSNMNLPWFHITQYGKRVLSSEECNPHDPTGYLESVRRRVSYPDDTVMTYLEESLKTFCHGNPLASTVMLGIAAERVFLLLGQAMHEALSEKKEIVRVWENSKQVRHEAKVGLDQ